MLTIDLQEAKKFVSGEEYNSASAKAQNALQQLKDKTGKGSEWLGWRDILAEPNDALLENIQKLAEDIRQEADIFIVCGIGGSYLGARAVIEALTPFYGDSKTEIIYAGNQMSGKYLKQLIDYISEKKADGSDKSVYLNVISKSGTTLETALAFRVLREWIHDTYEDDANSRIICTTSKEGGALNKVIDAQGYKKFIIPDDIGGRFSVLTPVGLLPIAVAGVDIRSLFYGAVSAFRDYENNPDDVISYAALRYALYNKGYLIDIFTSFEPELRFFGSWMQQLYGESEGKNGKGMFPTVLGYSTDLHSVGQMVQQGKRNVIETFLVVEKSQSKLTVPADDDNNDGLNYLSGKTFHEINTKAYEGTREAHIEGGVPVVSMTMNELKCETLGSLIYLFELSIAVYVYCLDENPFNQPGVEDYKKAMYRLLGKP
ncbi:MAG TPA: glucose-6-phosphate isomerase [Balneolales bacterium]|nr:glucose-6-phosphate isomerase [Balneolales bacterium]